MPHAFPSNILAMCVNILLSTDNFSVSLEKLRRHMLLLFILIHKSQFQEFHKTCMTRISRFLPQKIITDAEMPMAKTFSLART